MVVLQQFRSDNIQQANSEMFPCASKNAVRLSQPLQYEGTIITNNDFSVHTLNLLSWETFEERIVIKKEQQRPGDPALCVDQTKHLIFYFPVTW